MIDFAVLLLCGEGELYIAGGVESMSRAPFAMGKQALIAVMQKFMTLPLALL